MLAAEEPVVAVPAPVPVVLAQVPVRAQALPHPPLPLLAQRRREPELLVAAQLPVLVVEEDLVVEPAAPGQLLNLQSFSAAMAGNTRKPRATYEPVPKSR